MNWGAVECGQSLTLMMKWEARGDTAELFAKRRLSDRVGIRSAATE